MKYLVIFILVGFVTWTSVFSNALADSDPNDDYLKFSLDGFYIYADNKHITDILLYWNGESLPYGTITLDEKTNSDINIMIPKNIPRMVNIDFGSYMAVFYTDTLVVPIKEIETDCFYHLRIPVNDADEITIDSISVAAGRLKSVTADDPKCDDAYKHYFDTYEMQPPQARPVELLVPEPEQDILEYENCGSGTTYQDGICVVNETKVNTNSSGIWEPIIKYPVTAPLKQFNSGIPFNEIQCKENLERIQKHDDTPACVKSSSMWFLTEREWMKLVTFETISGFPRHEIENGQIMSMKLVKDESCFPYIIITIDSKDSGSLEIFVSRTILDPKINGQDDSLLVLSDGIEVAYDERNKSIQYRILNIQFEKGTKSIEIIATCLI